MRYRDYLQSKHWLDFRKEILKVRNRCQRCGTKSSLNLHHKHYRCLGKEKNEDIIVLCELCHDSYHKKRKWIKKYQAGNALNFTEATAKDRIIFNASNVLRKCGRCGGEHGVFYKIFRNGDKVLSIACPESKPRVTFLPYEDLDVPTLGTKIGK